MKLNFKRFGEINFEKQKKKPEKLKKTFGEINFEKKKKNGKIKKNFWRNKF